MNNKSLLERAQLQYHNASGLRVSPLPQHMQNENNIRRWYLRKRMLNHSNVKNNMYHCSCVCEWCIGTKFQGRGAQIWHASKQFTTPVVYVWVWVWAHDYRLLGWDEMCSRLKGVGWRDCGEAEPTVLTSCMYPSQAGCAANTITLFLNHRGHH